MEHKKRTFLLGAGFSKSIAAAPVMIELWDYIERAHDFEKNRNDLNTTHKEFRDRIFYSIKNFISGLESDTISRFANQKFDNIQTDIRQNIEYLLTLIDLHLKGPCIHFERKDTHITPYPFTPFNLPEKSSLEGLRKDLGTYLYLVFVKLKENHFAEEFANIINQNDEIVTFNYDVVLEKSLLRPGKWYPLGGYVGVNEFENPKDKLSLRQASKNSNLKIHKMHGSINWKTKGLIQKLYNNDRVMIVMDELESQEFFFVELSNSLNRSPEKIQGPAVHNPYVGIHEPMWMLPSFIKPFERDEIYKIWQSALKVIKDSEELVIIGYSFRYEDSNSYLLLSVLPAESKITIVDPNPEQIIDKIKSKGFTNITTYNSLRSYLTKIHN